MPKVKSNGIGGLRSKQLVKRHGQKLFSDVPRAEEVVLHLGVNDVATSTPKQIVANFDEITEKIKGKNPNVRITVHQSCLGKTRRP